jgi:CRISPR-associated protein Cmr5
MQTIQQKRAKFALERVQSAANNPKVDRAEYKSYASALPAMIHINGLGQAAAFYKAKGKGKEDDSHEMLYQILSKWLIKPSQPYAGEHDLIAAIANSDMHRYRLAQAEAQALMDWVKKFAKAYMTED